MVPVATLACLLAACGGKTASKTAAFLPAPVTSTVGEQTQPVVHMLDLFAALWKYDRSGRNRAEQKISFEIPEAEVNDYLAYALKAAPRPGVESVAVKLLPHSEVLVTAVIDLDAVAGWNPDLAPVLRRRMLSGKRAEIHFDVQFETHDGILNFTLKDANGPEQKAIPKKVAETIIGSLASRQPERYDTARPMQLPFGLQRVWTDRQLLCGET